MTGNICAALVQPAKEQAARAARLLEHYQSNVGNRSCWAGATRRRQSGEDCSKSRSSNARDGTSSAAEQRRSLERSTVLCGRERKAPR